MRNYAFSIILAGLFLFSAAVKGYSQGGNVTVQGTVFSSQTRQPVPFATVVIIEQKKKATTDEHGSYTLTLDKPGNVTVYVQAEGLNTLKIEMSFSKDTQQDFWLKPVRLSGGELVITGERQKQKLSRRTMRREELKATPASFNDSISALTSMPGIDRTDGFFGPLVIRGMYPSYNQYYVDGMPINYPMHFGGIHSVIANELMSEIDVYASSFPVEYGGPLASVIEINTEDNVKEFGGYADVGAISATVLMKRPFYTVTPAEEGEHKEYKGYAIASGRIGYMSLLVPLFYELVFNETITSVPEYFDYQFKTKYYFNKRHSLTFLAIGAKDYFNFLVEDDMVDEGDDPLIEDLKFKTDQVFHNQALTYTYDSGRFSNSLMVFSAWSQHYSYIDANELAADWLKDLTMDTRPYILGIKNTFDLEWWKQHAELRGAIEYTYYHFTVKGQSLRANTLYGIDLGDPDSATKFDVSGKTINRLYGGYLENRFTLGGLLLAPGVRIQYLERTDEAAIDPRGLVSYTFPTETTVSVAGGKYSSFLQTNPYMFAEAPDIAELTYADSEKAYHGAAGIEQKMDLFTFSVEGFYNYMFDLGVGYPHYVDGEYRRGGNFGKFKAYGCEVMLRKDMHEGRDGMFGWLSYTYTETWFKSGVTGTAYDSDGNPTGEPWDPAGDKWIPGDYDRTHALKLVLGYTYKQHTVSGRFQLYTAYPYTPIVGSTYDPSIPDRYAPVYSDDINSANLELDHRLDLRYTYKTGYEWGHVSWYIEVINVYGYWHRAQYYEWRYDKPYGNDNPVIKEEDDISIIPNFGVEVKF